MIENVRFGFDSVTTGNLMSYTFVAELILVPILGWAGDKYGNRTGQLVGHVLCFYGCIGL